MPENNKNNNINDELKSIHSGDAASLDESLYPYVIFTLHGNIFAINCKYVQSIEPIPATTTDVSQSSPEIRGVSYYKEQAINLIDLRKIFGIISQQDYLYSIVDIPKRIQEHVTFIEQLEDAVMNKKEITLSSDPHKCALGKWMDSYKPSSNIVKNQLSNIVEPHEMLHRSVIKIKDLMAFGKYDEAMEILNEVRDDYSANVLEGLGGLEKTLESEIKELSIIIRVGRKTLGIIVDNTESVEPIDNIQALPEFVVVSEYVNKYGLRNKDNSLLLVLEASAFA